MTNEEITLTKILIELVDIKIKVKINTNLKLTHNRYDSVTQMINASKSNKSFVLTKIEKDGPKFYKGHVFINGDMYYFAAEDLELEVKYIKNLPYKITKYNYPNKSLNRIFQKEEI